MSVNVDNINATIARIRANQNFKFNMKTWGADVESQVIDGAGHTCGTSACIAGFATIASGLAKVETTETEVLIGDKYVTIKADYIDFSNIELVKTEDMSESDADALRIGQVYLGLTNEQANLLFIPDMVTAYDDDDRSFSSPDYWEATEEQAIAVLEHLRDTGEVDWSVSGIVGDTGYEEACKQQIERHARETKMYHDRMNA